MRPRRYIHLDYLTRQSAGRRFKLFSSHYINIFEIRVKKQFLKDSRLELLAFFKFDEDIGGREIVFIAQRAVSQNDLVLVFEEDNTSPSFLCGICRLKDVTINKKETYLYKLVLIDKVKPFVREGYFDSC